MQLMRLSEVPTHHSDRVFRHSPARAMFVAVCTFCSSVGLMVFAKQSGSGLAYYVAGVLLVGLLIMHKFILARFRPSNWLLRINEQGLFLQFRSYLNHHFPETDLTVAFIAFPEILSVRRVDERSEIPYRDSDQGVVEKSTERCRSLVEFELSGESAALEKALAGERAKRPANVTLYKDYPVTMASPVRVQVKWNVVPGPEALFNALRPHTTIAAPTEHLWDYANLTSLSRLEQEKHLLDLMEAGRTIDAVYVARMLYSYDLTQARDFIEDLRQRGISA